MVTDRVRAVTPPIVVESDDLRELRQAVRAFVADQIASGAVVPAVDGWLSAWDEDFSRELARQGWVGMAIPTEYGGHGRSTMERFVVTEELLAAGAPVMAHWVADRQIAPSLLRFGTDGQKQHFLPRIARGECYFGIGMSEPDAGSDLASVRTRGERTDGGWVIRGTKVWTSGAHRAEGFFALARTAPLDEGQRHAGLTQFIIDLSSPGVTISPIPSMSGEAHFNEVHFDDVFVPDSMVLGDVGNGWHQVTSELSFERSGPERFMTTFPLLSAVNAATTSGSLPRSVELGRAVARVAALHQLSMAVSAELGRGGNADLAAAAVKVLGTGAEGEIAELADRLGVESTSGAAPGTLHELMRSSLLARPGFTLRGGTNEILRGVIARGLGLR